VKEYHRSKRLLAESLFVCLFVTWYSASGSGSLKVDLDASRNRRSFEKIPPSSQSSLFGTGRSWLSPWSPDQLWGDTFKQM